MGSGSHGMLVLTLDFDGVISDSAREAFEVAVRTYASVYPGSKLVESEELYRGFVELMPLGNRAEDYAVILAALEEEATVGDQTAYDAFYQGRDPERLGIFHERFYQARASWSERDPEGWRKMLAPYPGILEILHRRASQVTLAIATAKDGRSVRMLLRDYGIEALFRKDLVLDKDTGVTKCSHLQRLQRHLGVPYEAITFVDDKVNHLNQVAGLGVRCALAAWGYNGRREWEAATKAGYLLLQLDDLEAQLFE